MITSVADSVFFVTVPSLLTPIADITAVDTVKVQRFVKPAATQMRVVRPQQNNLTTADSACFMLNAHDDTYLFRFSADRNVADRNAARQLTADYYDTYDTIASRADVTTVPSTRLEYKELGQTALGGDGLWIFAVSVVAMLMTGFVHLRSRQFIPQMVSLLTSSFHWRSVSESLHLQNYWNSRMLQVSFYLLSSLAIYEIAMAYGYNVHTEVQGLELYGIILLLSVGFYTFKYMLHHLIGFAFDMPAARSSIVTAKMLATNIFGVIVIPAVLLFPFVSEAGYSVLGILTIVMMIMMYIWRLLISFKFILTDYLSVVYSLLYLCTVEAIPMVVIFKIGRILAS